MGFRDDVLTVLTGGLPSLLDGSQPLQVAQTEPVEATPPEPQLADRDPAFINLDNVSRGQILGVTALIVGALAVLAFTGR